MMTIRDHKFAMTPVTCQMRMLLYEMPWPRIDINSLESRLIKESRANALEHLENYVSLITQVMLRLILSQV